MSARSVVMVAGLQLSGFRQDGATFLPLKELFRQIGLSDKVRRRVERNAWLVRVSHGRTVETPDGPVYCVESGQPLAHLLAQLAPERVRRRGLTKCAEWMWKAMDEILDQWHLQIRISARLKAIAEHRGMHGNC